MKVQIISKELIKPSIPTPSNHHTNHISVTDELAPTLNIPLILYYSATIADGDPVVITSRKLDKVKNSLAQTLSQFYPLAGRYNKHVHTVDCNNQGVEYVVARLDGQLFDLLGERAKLKPESLNCLLPREIGAVDEVTDPLLAVQVTMFKCSGLTLGVLMSHRVGDASTISIFVNEWASASREEKIYSNCYSSFNSATYFPGKKFPRTDVGIPRGIGSNGVLETCTRVFSFNSNVISVLRDTFITKPQVSRVQLVFALIWGALMDVDEAKKGRPRTSFVFQPVNLRERTIPPIPRNTCGNLWTLANPKREVSERDIEVKDLVDRLCVAIKSTVEDSKKVLSNGEEGQMMVINPLLAMSEIARNLEVSSYCLSSWCKISLYEADFGWGKPEWVSSASLRAKNVVFLMDQKDGEGIEAWVHLDEEDMINFQKHVNITAFAI